MKTIGSDLASTSEQVGSGRNGGLRVVSADPSHLDSIIQIHLAAFEGFFLQSMGKRFLKELYRGFLTEPSGLCMVAIDGNAVLGFVVGTTEPERFFRKLLRNRWHAFVLAGVPSLALHPLSAGKKLLSALCYRGERPPELPNATLLSSIGVVSTRRGAGIGKILISAFCEEATASGALSVFLTTDRDKNDAVNHFYLANGFSLHSSFLKERNRRMNLYTRAILNT